MKAVVPGPVAGWEAPDPRCPEPSGDRAPDRGRTKWDRRRDRRFATVAKDYRTGCDTGPAPLENNEGSPPPINGSAEQSDADQGYGYEHARHVSHRQQASMDCQTGQDLSSADGDLSEGGDRVEQQDSA